MLVLAAACASQALVVPASRFLKRPRGDATRPSSPGVAAVPSRGGGAGVVALRPERALRPLSFLFVLSVAVVALAPAPALIEQVGSERATALLGVVGSLSAALEIALAPLVGALADSWGRKPVLLSVLVSVLCANGLAWMRPTVGALLCTKCVGSLVVGLYFLATGAMLGDAYKGDPGQLAATSGVLFALVNVGFASGIMLSSKLPGGVRAAYGAATAASVAALAFATLAVAETNPEKVPYKLEAFNPVSCARLFRDGREMRLLAALLAITLQPIFMGDVLQIFAIDQWKLTKGQVSTFFTLIPALGALGNVVGGKVAKVFGIQAFTAVATLSNLLFWCGCCVSHEAALACAVVGFLGPARTLGASTSLTNLAGKRKIPQGRLSGDRANLVAWLKILGPLVYGKLYVAGLAAGRPTLPFALNIGLTLGALALAPFALRTASGF